MKAVFIEEFGGPEVLKVRDTDIPEIGEKQILIRVAYAGVNFADIKSRTGQYHGAKKPPFVPGLDVAGTVEKIGSKVSSVKVGDRVIAFPNEGTYVEYAVADEVLTFPIAESIDFKTAAAIPTICSTSYNLLGQVGRIAPGESVLIHAAAGGVGTVAIQIAKGLGAGTVIGTVGSDEKVTIAKEVGADHVINYRKESFGEKVNGLTNGKGVDIILDSVGGVVFQESLSCLAMYGRLVNFNSSSGTGGSVNTKELHASCRAVLGYSLGTTRKHRPEALKSTAEAVLPLIEEGKVKPVISDTYPLEDAKEVHRKIESRQTVGKLLLQP